MLLKEHTNHGVIAEIISIRVKYFALIQITRVDLSINCPNFVEQQIELVRSSVRFKHSIFPGE